jgi:hypothetical protein
VVTSARAIAAIVLLAGIIVGTVADTVPDRTSPRAGEYWVLAGDFHVHAFPGDGALVPWALREEARRAGLDVFALTNHNNMVAVRLWRQLGGSANGPIVVGGEEITNPAYHLIAVGIGHVVEGTQPAALAVDAVHAQGGVAIAAHPGRRYWNAYDSVMTRLDGAEVAHPAADTDARMREDLLAFSRRAVAERGHLAAIGSSDVHVVAAMGTCRTYLLVRERTEAGVIDAIRDGRTVAADGEGRLYGDPALVQLVSSSLPGGRSDEHPGWQRFALAITWTALLGFVLLRG